MPARRARPRPPRQRLHALGELAPLRERVASLGQWLRLRFPETGRIPGRPPLRQISAALRERVATLGQRLRLHLPEIARIRGRSPPRQVAAALRERRSAPGKRPAWHCWLVRISHAAVS